VIATRATPGRIFATIRCNQSRQTSLMGRLGLREAPVPSVLYVVRSEDRWSIEAGKARLGPFASRSYATGMAIDAAMGAGSSGHPCQVIVQSEHDDNWERVWPPRGDRPTLY